MVFDSSMPVNGCQAFWVVRVDYFVWYFVLNADIVVIFVFDFRDWQEIKNIQDKKNNNNNNDFDAIVLERD